jgi:acetyl-CoA carboxylase biotin carboxylase subunit
VTAEPGAPVPRDARAPEGAPPRPIRKLLVANRGEIAVRIIRAAHEMGLRTVAVYSDADRTALHVRSAHEAVRLGPAAPAESYLSATRVLAAARISGADAVHPGYGFLSEKSAFAKGVEDAGLVFVGPPSTAMLAMGDKLSARRSVAGLGVPLVPGAELPDANDASAVHAAAGKVGFPLIVKAAAGGGGKGMRRVERAEDLLEAVVRAGSEATTAFGDARVYLERWVKGPRHVEVQVLADDHGHVVALGERECSVQRRHQKVIEESPSCAVGPDLRRKMEEAAVTVARACGYRSAGTVEFLVGADGGFYFLEMNTRIQVEHPVTEMRYGVDLVAEQLRVAQGLPISIGANAPLPTGHAIEARVCAEDGDAGFLPSTGRLGAVTLPGGPGIRLDGHVVAGQEITLHYDNLLLKLVAHAPDRARAIARLKRALHETRLPGVTTNLPLLLRTLDDPRFLAGDYDTSLLEGSRPREPVPGDLVPVVAAALALHRRAPRAAPAPAPAGPALSPWVQAARASWGERR